jgi:nicotinamidase-related amidase
MSSALLVIDVQQALCTGEEAAYDIERVLRTINSVAGKARPAGAPVVFVQHEEDAGSLAFGTAGWQLADGLAAQPDDLRIRKTQSDSFLKTPLQEVLQARGVTDLVVCGLQSDFCVAATVRGAVALGYRVTLVEDGHSTVDNGGRTAAEISAAQNASLRELVALVPAAGVRF